MRVLGIVLALVALLALASFTVAAVQRDVDYEVDYDTDADVDYDVDAEYDDEDVDYEVDYDADAEFDDEDSDFDIDESDFEDQDDEDFDVEDSDEDFDVEDSDEDFDDEDFDEDVDEESFDDEDFDDEDFDADFEDVDDDGSSGDAWKEVKTDVKELGSDLGNYATRLGNEWKQGAIDNVNKAYNDVRDTGRKWKQGAVDEYNELRDEGRQLKQDIKQGAINAYNTGVNQWRNSDLGRQYASNMKDANYDRAWKPWAFTAAVGQVADRNTKNWWNYKARPKIDDVLHYDYKGAVNKIWQKDVVNPWNKNVVPRWNKYVANPYNQIKNFDYKGATKKLWQKDFVNPWNKNVVPRWNKFVVNPIKKVKNFDYKGWASKLWGKAKNAATNKWNNLETVKDYRNSANIFGKMYDKPTNSFGVKALAGTKAALDLSGRIWKAQFQAPAKLGSWIGSKLFKKKKN